MHVDAIDKERAIGAVGEKFEVQRLARLANRGWLLRVVNS